MFSIDNRLFLRIICSLFFLNIVITDIIILKIYVLVTNYKLYSTLLLRTYVVTCIYYWNINYSMKPDNTRLDLRRDLIFLNHFNIYVSLRKKKKKKEWNNNYTHIITLNFEIIIWEYNEWNDTQPIKFITLTRGSE